MPTNKEEQKKVLRNYLNGAIKGPNTEAVLEALATGSAHLINNVEAVNDTLYIVSASEKYLDSRLADREITRPEQVGLSDEVFRKLGIEVSNRKQVRDLMGQILEVIYGEEFTRATIASSRFEPFNLADGDVLLVQFDDSEVLELPMPSSQFQNINAATAQEVADAITKILSSLGKKSYAVAKDDGVGGYVTIISGTIGSSSSIKILGGRAQNILQFPLARPTSAQSSTQWTLTYNGSLIRMTWSGGAEPFTGKVKKGDYVNIYGSGFNSLNTGTFNIENARGGVLNQAYVEFFNPNGVPEIAVQGQDDGVLFFNPQRQNVASKYIYAGVFQTSPRLVEVFVPATTRVVRRDRKGAAHLYDSGPAIDGQYGPYVFDTSKPYTINDKSAILAQNVGASSPSIISVNSSIDIPDQQGNLVFGFGTSKEEGPVPYIGRPSSTTLRISPSYKFKNKHDLNTEISLVQENYSYTVDSIGEDFPFYATDSISGRLYSEELIKLVAATGIQLIINILYPNDIGLGKYATENSEKTKVWGE